MPDGIIKHTCQWMQIDGALYKDIFWEVADVIEVKDGDTTNEITLYGTFMDHIKVECRGFYSFSIIFSLPPLY